MASQVQTSNKASQVQTSNKRTLYKILQISDDADTDAINAAYQRLKVQYVDAIDMAARNELLFIEHAYMTLSDAHSRKTYDRQITQAFAPSSTFQYVDDSSSSWFSSPKLFVVMIGVLAIVAFMA